MKLNKKYKLYVFDNEGNEVLINEVESTFEELKFYCLKYHHVIKWDGLVGADINNRIIMKVIEV